MNREETGVLLAYAAGLDTRMHTVDATQAEFTRRSWANALEPVPIEFAMDQVTRYYRTETDKVLKPAPILIAWRNHERTQFAKARTVADQVSGSIPSAAPSWFRGYAAKCTTGWVEARTYLPGRAWQDAKAAARAAIEAIPHPTLGEPSFHDLKADERRRDCHVAGCACPHVVCRSGFMDEETRVIGPFGPSHPAVKRCPFCTDAVTMREELAPRKRKAHR